jgi:hypothetical protein
MSNKQERRSQNKKKKPSIHCGQCGLMCGNEGGLSSHMKSHTSSYKKQTVIKKVIRKRGRPMKKNSLKISNVAKQGTNSRPNKLKYLCSTNTQEMIPQNGDDGFNISGKNSLRLKVR